jgi:hypothetical protein
MVFPLGTEEKIDCQCPNDIALTPFGVTVKMGFQQGLGEQGVEGGVEVEGLGVGGGEAEALKGDKGERVGRRGGEVEDWWAGS